MKRTWTLLTQKRGSTGNVPLLRLGALPKKIEVASISFVYSSPAVATVSNLSINISIEGTLVYRLFPVNFANGGLGNYNVFAAPVQVPGVFTLAAGEFGVVIELPLGLVLPNDSIITVQATNDDATDFVDELIVGGWLLD